MSAHPAGVARKPVWRRPQFWRAALPVASVLAALIAGILVYNSIYGSNGQPESQTGWGVTYPAPKPPKTVKLDPTIRPLVQRFVMTAVARKNLDAAYAISGPEIRQGQTLKQFRQGNIAVVPFDVDARTRARVTKIDHSYATSVQLEVFLDTPGRNVTNSPHTFYVNLLKQHGRWFVNGWTPRWTPPIPSLPGG
jgi:hypothetical protein